MIAALRGGSVIQQEAVTVTVLLWRNNVYV